jgi:protein gp37
MSTSIEWTDETWNPVLGCDRVSPGCDGCYAITSARIRGNNPNPKIRNAYAGLTERRDGRIDWTGRINLIEDRLTEPLRWKKPRRIFVNSMSDLFHDKVDVGFIAEVFAVMAAAHWHTFQVLTKRHGRMRHLLNEPDFLELVKAESATLAHEGVDIQANNPWEHWPLLNVWLGVSVEDQKRADLRIPALLDTPAAIRWISAEPLLGPVDLSHWLSPITWPECWDQHEPTSECPQCIRPEWVVCGGESGHGGRPMHPDWARHMRDQCAAVGVPFLFKQHGNWVPVGPLYGDTDEVDDAHMEAAYLEVNERKKVVQLERSGHVADGHQPTDPRTWLMANVGKKAAGRELDGRIWDQYPEAVTAR